jgi:hypothetical protein
VGAVVAFTLTIALVPYPIIPDSVFEAFARGGDGGGCFYYFRAGHVARCARWSGPLKRFSDQPFPTAAFNGTAGMIDPTELCTHLIVLLSTGGLSYRDNMPMSRAVAPGLPALPGSFGAIRSHCLSPGPCESRLRP